MLLFRRRPREKDSEAEGKPATEPEPPGSGGSVARAGPPSAPAPGAGGNPPGGPPPPLPQGPPEPTVVAPGPTSFTRCFVCGSPLEARGCPVCKIAWVE